MDQLNNTSAFDKKDFLIAVLLLLITWLFYLLFHRQQRIQATTHRTQPVVVQERAQELIQREVPSNSITRDLTVSSTGNSAVTAGIIQAERDIKIELVQDIKDPPPDFELILNNMKEMLETRYKNLRIRGLPWLPKVSFSLEDCYVHLALADQKTPLELKEIFLQTKTSNKPTRILIEGAAGFGKTTLVCKLCNDWVKKEKYMACFDLVIVLHLRYFKNDFHETLSSTLNVNSWGGINTVLETIDVNANKTLLVLEGYDEAPPTAKEYLLPILRSAEMKRVTVLVTSRPGKFMAGSLFDADGYEDVIEDFRTYFDKKITIVGLLQEHQQMFLEKHLIHLDGYSSEKLLTVKDHLSQIVPPDFLACPLFLLMLVFAYRCGNTSEVKSKTDLFKLVFNFIVRRFLSKNIDSNHEVRRPSKADIFKFDHRSCPEYVTVLSDLGKLSITALETDRLVFTQEELLNLCDESNMLLHIGLLNPTTEVNGIWNEVYYEPVHKSLLEFLAAYSLWISYMDNQDSFETTFQHNSFLRPAQETASSSLVFPFLCGLFGSVCPILLKCLKPFTNEYSYWFGSLCFSLQECILTNAVLNSLEFLFPEEWRIPWYDADAKFSVSSNHQKLIQNALRSGNTKIIRWFLETPASFPSTVQVNVLVLVVGTQHRMSKFSASKCKVIQCSELWCDLRTPHSSSEDWEDFMEYVTCIRKDTISFILCTTYSYVWLPFVHQSATQHNFGVSKIHWLHCWLKRKQKHTLSLITRLIQTESLSGLNLLIVPSSILAPIFDVLRYAISNVATDLPVRAAANKAEHSSCVENHTAEGRNGLLADVCTNDSKLQSLTDHVFPLSASHINDESSFSQNQVLTSILVNAHQVFSSFNELIQSKEDDPSSTSKSSSKCTPAIAALPPYTSQQMSLNSCTEFGSAAIDFIAALKCDSETKYSKQDSSVCTSATHELPILEESSDQVFGSSAVEFILSTKTNQQKKTGFSLSHISLSTAADKREKEVHSKDVWLSLTDKQTDGAKYSSITPSMSSTNCILDPSLCNIMNASISLKKEIARVSLDSDRQISIKQNSSTSVESCCCTETDTHEDEASICLTKACITTEAQGRMKSSCKRSFHPRCSTLRSDQTSYSGKCVSSLNSSYNPLPSTKQDFSLLPLITSWMNIFDNLSTDLPTLFEELGLAGMCGLEECFTRSDLHSTEVKDILEGSQSVIKNHMITLYDQTRNFFKHSPKFRHIYEHWSPLSIAKGQFFSKIENTHKLTLLFYSFLQSNCVVDWLNNLSQVLSNPDNKGDVSKQMAQLFRALASLLNEKAESASNLEPADDCSRLDCLLQALRSFKAIASSIVKEAKQCLKESQNAALIKISGAFRELCYTLIANFGPYFCHPSEIHTISVDSLTSMLEKLELLSASILSIIEDPNSIFQLVTLMERVLPLVHSILLLFADLSEHFDETNVDVHHLEWVKDIILLLFSFASSMVGLTYKTTPVLSKTLNSMVDAMSIIFPAVVFAISICLHLCETDANEVMGPAAFQEICGEFLHEFYGLMSNLQQLPPSTDIFSIEWLLFMLSPIKFGTSSMHLNLSAANFQGRCDAYDCLPISQSDFNSLIEGAAYSMELKNLSISNHGTLSLTIDADMLLNHGDRSWNELKIAGDIEMHFNGNTSVTREVNHLCVRTDKHQTFNERLLKCVYCQSLQCSQELLMSTLQEKCQFTSSITELNVCLTSLTDIGSLINSMKQIETLGITLEVCDAEPDSFSVKELLPLFSASSMLKRFEIWNVNVNPTAAGIIAKTIIECLMDHHSDKFIVQHALKSTSLKELKSKSVEREYHLDCLMLHMDIDIVRFKTVTSIMHERFKISKRLENVGDIMEHPKRLLLDIVADIKLPLTKNKLSSLELVSMTSPPAWSEMFPHDEDFTIKYSILRKETDINRNTSESDLPPFLGHQFTITHM